jgi:hypothetical protein
MSENMFSIVEEIPDDKLLELSNLVREYKDVEEYIEKKEEDLKKSKLYLEKISRERIPALFNGLGLSMIKLQSGQVVSIEDKLKASIADKDYLVAYRNMIDAENGNIDKIDSLFKSKIIVGEVTDEVMELLLEKDIPYDTKEKFTGRHWQNIVGID